MAAVDPNDDASRLAPPLVPALVQLAESRGMTPASDDPSRLEGKVGDVTVSLAGASDGAAFEIGVRPAAPFGFRFTIATKATGISTWFADPDVKVGHGELDDAYDIHAEDAERLKAMVDPSLGEELFQLGTGRKLRFDENGLTIVDDAEELEPAMVAPLLDRAAALLASLVRMDRLGSG